MCSRKRSFIQRQPTKDIMGDSYSKNFGNRVGNNYAEDQEANYGKPILRSTSLNKDPAKNTSNCPFIEYSTYKPYPKHFHYKLKKSNGLQSPFNKTAANWKILHSPSVSSKSNEVINFFPMINNKSPISQFAFTRSIGSKKDSYIKYIAENKRTVTIKKNKETPNFQSFDLDGVRFEVSVEREGSVDLENNLDKGYSNNMNLIYYDFNSDAIIKGRETRPKIRIKTSMNFYKENSQKDKLTTGKSKAINRLIYKTPSISSRMTVGRRKNIREGIKVINIRTRR